MKLNTLSYFRSGDEIRLKTDVALPELSTVLEDLKYVGAEHETLLVKSITVVLEEQK